MATITVKNIPDDLYDQLKQAAEANRRSINSEIIVCIERQVSGRRRSPDDILQRARAVRVLTSAAPIAPDAFDQAKREGPAMIVVDTNIIGYLHLTGPNSGLAEQVLQRDPEWVAPVLWRSEMHNVLALYLRQGMLTLEQALTIMDTANDLMRFGEYEVASHSVLRLAHQSNCSAYDCEFVALAEVLKVQLVTSDKKLLAAFPDLAVSPEVFCQQEVDED